MADASSLRAGATPQPDALSESGSGAFGLLLASPLGLGGAPASVVMGGPASVVSTSK